MIRLPLLMLFLATAAAAESPVAIKGYDYAAPNLPEGSRLLFIGDSITDMKWGRNEKDRNHYLGHSYVFLLAARLHADQPAAKLEFFNRGISGNTVGNLRARWQKDAIAMKPDVLTILIGVNDVGRAVRGNTTVDLKQWEDDYRAILTASRKANPKVKIILMNPFVLRMTRMASDEAWNKWRGQCDQLRPIVKKLATEFQAVHVETQKHFDEAAAKSSPQHWIWDGVHPLPQGHELIARHWLSKTSKKLRD